MPCITDISSADEAKHFETLLCQACKFLTAEQIDSLKNPGSGIRGGLDWYTNHLFLDCRTSRSTEQEKQLAHIELNRIGFDIIPYKDIGESLVKLNTKD